MKKLNTQPSNKTQISIPNKGPNKYSMNILMVNHLSCWNLIHTWAFPFAKLEKGNVSLLFLQEGNPIKLDVIQLRTLLHTASANRLLIKLKQQ